MLGGINQDHFLPFYVCQFSCRDPTGVGDAVRPQQLSWVDVAVTSCAQMPNVSWHKDALLSLLVLACRVCLGVCSWCLQFLWPSLQFLWSSTTRQFSLLVCLRTRRYFFQSSRLKIPASHCFWRYVLWCVLWWCGTVKASTRCFKFVDRTESARPLWKKHPRNLWRLRFPAPFNRVTARETVVKCSRQTLWKMNISGTSLRLFPAETFCTRSYRRLLCLLECIQLEIKYLTGNRSSSICWCDSWSAVKFGANTQASWWQSDTAVLQIR